MRNIKDVLRLKLDAKLSHEQIAAALGISKGVVTKYVGLAAAAGLDWPAVQASDEVILARRLLVAPDRPRSHVQPDFGRIHQELRRKGMTLMLLWEEHQTEHAASQTYSYSQAGHIMQRLCADRRYVAGTVPLSLGAKLYGGAGRQHNLPRRGMLISRSSEEIVMLEHYYVRPVTIDRVRTSWIAPAIEQYVGWLSERRYSSRTVPRRIPLLIAFGDFAKESGGAALGRLDEHVEPFVDRWVVQRAKKRRGTQQRKKIGDDTRNAVRQLLRQAIPGYMGRGRPHRPDNPFAAQAPEFT